MSGYCDSLAPPAARSCNSRQLSAHGWPSRTQQSFSRRSQRAVNGKFFSSAPSLWGRRSLRCVCRRHFSSVRPPGSAGGARLPAWTVRTVEESALRCAALRWEVPVLQMFHDVQMGGLQGVLTSMQSPLPSLPPPHVLPPAGFPQPAADPPTTNLLFVAEKRRGRSRV